MKPKFLFILSLIFILACNDFLNIVPEGTPTLDDAFTNRTRAKEFLATCYRYLPDPTDPWTYPGYAGNEFFWNTLLPYDTYFDQQEMTMIKEGRQQSSSPYLNFWGGGGGEKVGNIFEGIRMCNIFLENIEKPYDLKNWEKDQWIGEVKFLKAYYHFFLLQLYGPIPLIKENTPINSKPEDVRVFREPFDDCVNYIVELLDEASQNLPSTVGNDLEEAGRITKPIALSLKAKTLVLAASDLFNGNPDYATFTDKRGIHLFPTEKKTEKWQIAADAIKEAIEVSIGEGGIKLYESRPFNHMPDQLKLLLTLRGVVTEKWNSEIIWGTTKIFDTNDKGNMRKGYPWGDLARQSLPILYPLDAQLWLSECGVPMHIAELFYTDQGIPIEDDPNWNVQEKYALRTATAEERYIIREGQQTARFNFNREPRFYANLAFDASIFQMKVTEVPGDGNNPIHPYVQGLRGQISGYSAFRGVNPTGYWAKKLVSYGTSGTYKPQSTEPSLIQERYALPLIRLSDLFLLYSEALNEIRPIPDEDVYYWIDRVRERAGLTGVVEAWSKSKNREKPLTQKGMREIIRRERMIELVFEGQMFFDLRRWKDAAFVHFNKPIQGWTIEGNTKELYYQVQTIYNPNQFRFKDFLWPIKDYYLTINPNLVQNPGW